jgi:uncharacterized protein (TIGR03435 family)
MRASGLEVPVRVPLLAVLVTAGIVTTAAQEPKPAFEVTSVRPNTLRPDSMSIGGPPGRFEARNVTLELLITRAYGVRRELLEGGPDWIRDERYDVAARAPDGAPADQQDLMLQSLLEDRFGLVTHRETRDGEVYALVLAREGAEPGPRLTPTTDDCVRIREERAAAAGEGAGRGGRGASVVGGGGRGTERAPCTSHTSQRARQGGGFVVTYSMGGVTLEALARLLEGSVGAPVEDRPGLVGEYDVALEFLRQPALTTVAPGESAPIADDAPSVFTAVEEQLGLKLQAGRGPLALLVIDRVERPEPD